MQAASLLESLFRYKAWANAEIIAGIAQVDAANQPETLRSAIRILNHTYVVDRIFAGHLEGRPHGYEGTNTAETPTWQDLRTAITASDRWYLNYVTTASPAALAESIEFSFVDGDPGTMTREEILAHVITHGSYHRGGIARVLAAVSVVPTRDVFTGYLHQVEPARRAHETVQT